MPNFNVFLERNITALGSTRAVLIPYPANPVTAADGTEAITTVASRIFETFGEDHASGTYVAAPAAGALRLNVTGFNPPTPIFES